MTNHEELMAALKEINTTVTALQLDLARRPNTGALFWKCLEPRMIVSLAFLLGVFGFLVGRVATIEGFGFRFSSEQQNNARVAALAADRGEPDATAPPVRPTEP